jgi:hypothetical protein
VNRLTLYQACLFMGAFSPEDGQVAMTPSEYAAMFRPP